jgi:hypothetical protein
VCYTHRCGVESCTLCQRSSACRIPALTRNFYRADISDGTGRTTDYGHWLFSLESQGVDVACAVIAEQDGVVVWVQPEPRTKRAGEMNAGKIGD